MKRREFLKYIGLGGVGTGLGLFIGQFSKPPGAKLIPYLIPPEDVVPGVANWYSSLCTQCSAGCGIQVKVMEGRVKKIEGNPAHPVNKGKLCARGQASVQALYNPDRIEGPLRRTGERGSGSYEKISWEEALKTLAGNLSELKEGGGKEKLYLLTGGVSGHLNILINDFMRAYGSKSRLTHELFSTRSLEYANRVSLGLGAVPYYDIAKTKHLVSFGADFSSTWLSAVNLSYGYGLMRQGTGKRGKLVQVEPRMSLTGASADEWVPAKPGTEGVLALAMANYIVKRGYYKGRYLAAWKSLLAEFTPRHAAEVTGVGEERIKALAKDFAEDRPSLAIGGDNIAGYESGASVMVAINILNYLAGNIGVEGGLVPNPDESPVKGVRGAKDGLSALIADAAASKISTLIVHGTNPVFTAPGGADVEAALNKISFIASFSTFMDETTAIADLILPAHTALEDWGDDFASPSVGYPVATLMQPAVSPVHNTRGIGDIYITLGAAMGGPVGAKMPAAKGYKEYLKSSWKALYGKDKAMRASAIDFGQFWNRLLARGGWWPEPSKGRKRSVGIAPNLVKRHIAKAPSGFMGDAKKYPFHLMLYPQTGFGDGRGANLPWLQEMPDTMTSVVWGSWVEINPATAGKLGIKEGDMLTVESPTASIEAPAYLYAGIRPDTIGIPVGQGHSEYGRYAGKRGANPLELLPAKADPDSGAFALNITRVRITRGKKFKGFVKMAASDDEHGRSISMTISPAELSGGHPKVSKH
jgi:anaerobic selenocysteine-containing dehydrogenase